MVLIPAVWIWDEIKERIVMTHPNLPTSRNMPVQFGKINMDVIDTVRLMNLDYVIVEGHVKVNGKYIMVKERIPLKRYYTLNELTYDPIGRNKFVIVKFID